MIYQNRGAKLIEWTHGLTLTLLQAANFVETVQSRQGIVISAPEEIAYINTMIIIPDKEEGGYTVYFPDLPGCATCVESLDEVKEMAEDAKREWLKAALEDGVEIKSPQEFSGQLRLRMPQSLHQQLSYRASEEGVYGEKLYGDLVGRKIYHTNIIINVIIYTQM